MSTNATHTIKVAMDERRKALIPVASADAAHKFAVAYEANGGSLASLQYELKMFAQDDTDMVVLMKPVRWEDEGLVWEMAD